MCFSSPDVDTPAGPQLVANLPPNVLQLGAEAKQQLSGGGKGLQDLRIDKKKQVTMGNVMPIVSKNSGISNGISDLSIKKSNNKERV